MLFNAFAVLTLLSLVSSSPIQRFTLAGRGDAATSGQTAGQSASQPAGQDGATTVAGASAANSSLTHASATPAGASANESTEGECSHGTFQCSDQDLQGES